MPPKSLRSVLVVATAVGALATILLSRCGAAGGLAAGKGSEGAPKWDR